MPADADPADSPADAHRDAATAFSDRVAEAFDDEVLSLYLFGSVAEGTHGRDSDVDVLAVVADDADYGAVDDRLLDIAYEVLLDYGVPVEVHTMRASEFAARQERGEPFVTSVCRGETRV